MRMIDLIEQKKAGKKLKREEIQALVQDYVQGQTPDYQMAALLMAICFQGMDLEETAALTLSMMHSGDVVDLSDIPGTKVDKHSTGGVGDTTTLVVGPLVAACGGKVAKMSGRGLGHTGGTLDKLESIPGLCVEQPMARFKELVQKNGLAVIGQTGNLVPADKKMYALRDVTGTVSSVPLIASSIMSKKLAAGADAIVLDVKTGSGAFMQTLEGAQQLARTMVNIGKHLGKRVVAVITDMDQPLGLAVGNALEVREAVELLSGRISAGDPLYEVCMLLGSHMLLLSDLANGPADAREKLEKALKSGAGLEKLREMVAAQGGDASYIDIAGIERLCAVKQKVPLKAKGIGRVAGMNAGKIGVAAQMLGAGRATKEDKIDPAVGLVMHKRLGDAVADGETLCTLYVNDETRVEESMRMLYEGIQVQQSGPTMVYGVVE